MIERKGIVSKTSLMIAWLLGVIAAGTVAASEDSQADLTGPIKIVDLLKFHRFCDGCSRHTREFVVHSEVVL